MSATMTLPIDIEIESWLADNAAAQGVKAEQFAVEALRRLARRPSIDEVFAGVQAEFAASGMTDEELSQIIERALAEVRAARNGGGRERHPANYQANGAAAHEPVEQETIGERLERKGLLGMIDSSQPRPDSPPNKSALGDLFAEKFRQQGLIISS